MQIAQFIELSFTPSVLTIATTEKQCGRLIGGPNLDFVKEGFVVTALLTLGLNLVYKVFFGVRNHERFNVQR
jgi:hypothetical protein